RPLRLRQRAAGFRSSQMCTARQRHNKRETCNVSSPCSFVSSFCVSIASGLLSVALLSTVKLRGDLHQAKRTHAVSETPVALETQRVVGVCFDDAAVEKYGAPLAAGDAPMVGANRRRTPESSGLF